MTSAWGQCGALRTGALHGPGAVDGTVERRASSDARGLRAGDQVCGREVDAVGLVHLNRPKQERHVDAHEQGMGGYSSDRLGDLASRRLVERLRRCSRPIR